MSIIYRNQAAAEERYWMAGVGEIERLMTPGAIGITIAGGITALSTYALYNIRAELAMAKSADMQFATNMSVNIVSTMLTLTRYYFGNEARIKPAAVISGIPLGTVTELSYAISNRVLKFRSKGGIFLAHQAGGDQTLNITGKAWGPNRFWFLIMLDFLFMYGQASTYDMFAAGLRSNNLISVSTEKTLPEGILGKSPWAKIDLFDTDDGVEEKHLTFPVITRNRVYNNMYIETYDYKESVELGRNVIEYNLFFRKYLPETRYKFATILQEKEKDYELDEVWYYSEDEDDLVSKRLRNIDLMTDLGFSLAMLVYRTFVILNKNSPELNIAMTFGINLNKQVMGDYKEEVAIQLQYDGIGNYDNLVNLSTKNKEELFVIG